MAQGDLIETLNVRLAAGGIKLEFRDGDLWIAARSDSERRQFEAEHGETIRRLRGLLHGRSAAQVVEPTPPAVSNNDVPTRWEHLNDHGGLDAMMGIVEPPAVPVAQVVIQPPAPGRVKFPPAPRYQGIPILDAHGQAWRARRDRARFLNEPFDERPPYDMTAFGTSNEP
jgi:hypothetical protein